MPGFVPPRGNLRGLVRDRRVGGSMAGGCTNPISLAINGPAILQGVQPTIFPANSSLLRTSDTHAAREMVGWVSFKLEGHGCEQALNQPRTPGFQPTHPTFRPWPAIFAAEQNTAELSACFQRHFHQPIADAERRSETRQNWNVESKPVHIFLQEVSPVSRKIRWKPHCRTSCFRRP